MQKLADSKFSDARAKPGHGPGFLGDLARPVLARRIRFGLAFLLTRPGPNRPIPTLRPSVHALPSSVGTPFLSIAK